MGKAGRQICSFIVHAKGVDKMRQNTYTLSNTQTIRIVYMDYLRVFATFAVMILHISAQKWYTTDVNGFAWQTFNFFDSIVRWSVPVFVMISGALFLDRDIPLRRIYAKYVLRLMVAFFVWSAIYALFSDGDIATRVFMFLKGHYHMWFILMIAGIYICMPFIKAIINSETRLKYYLILAFIFAFVIPELLTLVSDFAPYVIIKSVQTVNQHANTMRMHIVLGYASYFVLGYYLNKVDLSKAGRIIIYILGIIGSIATIFLDLIVALRTQKCYSMYYGDFNVNILLESMAVFTWFKHKKFN